MPVRVYTRLAVLRLRHRLCTLPDERLTGDGAVTWLTQECITGQQMIRVES